MKRTLQVAKTLSALMLVLAEVAVADTAPPLDQPTSAIPLDQIGAVAGKQYSGDGLSITATSGGAFLRCVFQRLDGEATKDGLWLTSTVADQTNDRIRVKATAVGQKALPASGEVFVAGQTVRFCRPGLVEEYSVSMDGVRQDFVVLERPGGASVPASRLVSSLASPADGELRVELSVKGAKVEQTVYGAQLVLEKSGRKIAYTRLIVTDAQGRHLPARLEVASNFPRTKSCGPMAMALFVDDTTASYPIRIDPTFTDDNWISTGGISGVNGWVLAAATDASGNLYVGGSFTVAGTTFASNVAKWDGASWSALGSGVNGAVTALAVSGNEVFVGGDFTMAGGVPSARVAKWNGTNWSALGSGMDGSVNALAVAGGELYAGGGFTSAGGNAATNIAKWTGSGWVALGSGMNNQVLALAASGTNVYAGGRFTVAGGVVAFRTARWNGNSWSALGQGMNSTVHALHIWENELYAGGEFWQADYNPANRIAKWNGSSWSALNWGVGTSSFDASVVLALTSAGTNLYVAGDFEVAAGVTTRKIARWHANGWSNVGFGLGPPNGGIGSGEVYALAASSSNIFAGGNFQNIGVHPAKGIMRWELTVSSWRSLGVGADLPCRALTASGTNVYAIGQFTTLSGYSSDYIVRWNGVNWDSLGFGLAQVQMKAVAASGSNVYAAGAFTTAGITPANNIARWNGTTWSALGSGLNGFATAVAVSGSNVYVAGQFTSAGGVPANRIAKWDGSAWSALGSGLNGWVHALAVSGNDVYAGGEFTSYVAKWNGTNWIALGDGVNNYVRAIAVSGSNVYVGGDFSSAGAVSALGVARWNGSSWSAVGNQLVSPIYALAVSGNDLYAGGWNSPLSWSNYVARWNGTNWTPLGSGIGGVYNPRVFALAATSDSVYVGGDFLTAGGKLSACVARANLGEAPATLLDALDNASFIWSTGGVANWFAQTNVTHDGVDAAQSGPVGRYQSSILNTTVTGPGTLSFWWKASSSGNYFNYLNFLLNGVYAAGTYGYFENYGWQQQVIYLPAGSNALNWVFYNNNPATNGNAGWLDQVSFVPGGAAPVGVEVTYDRLPSWRGGSATFEASTTGGTPPFVYQLLKEGNVVMSGTNSMLTLTNVQASDASSAFSIRVTNDYGATILSNLSIYLTPIASWGDNSAGQRHIPEGLSGVVKVIAGMYHSLALQANGTVAGWGDPYAAEVPMDLTNVVDMAAGEYHSLALLGNGTVVAWGDNWAGQSDVPPSLSNVAAVAAGASFSAALRTNGTVVCWGGYADDVNLVAMTTPAGLNNIKSIAAGYAHCLALRSNGTVVAWGDNSAGQTNVPASLSNVVAVAAGVYHNLALRSDGTVVGWGGPSDLGLTNAPIGASNVVAITTKYYHNLALRADGHVIAWGEDSDGQSSVPASLTNAIAVAAGFRHSLALVEPSRPVILQQPHDLTVTSNSPAAFTVVASSGVPIAYQWYFNTNSLLPNATNASVIISNSQAANAGLYRVVLSNSFGSVTSSFARLTVVTMPGLMVMPGSGGLPQIQFTGTPGTFCDIEKSTNLVHWTYAGRVLAGDVLNLEQLDADWRTSPGAFFRVALASSQQLLPPTIVQQPLGVVAPPGGAARFSVVATGSLPFQYQWKVNGTNVDGATRSSLLLTNVQLAQAGSYSVVINGPGGSAVSVVAPLYVQSGEIPNGDDFDDGASNLQLWGTVIAWGSEYPMMVETNGYLEFVGTDSLAAQTWIGSQGSYDQDWEVLADVNLPNLNLTEDWASVTLLMIIGHNDGEAVWEEDTVRLSFDLTLDPTINLYRTFGSWADANGEETGWNEMETPSTQATFRFTFSAANKTLTAWVDEDGSANGVAWTEMLAQRVDALGADWGMSAGSRFVIGIGAFAGGHIVNPGDGVFFDNFITLGGFVLPTE